MLDPAGAIVFWSFLLLYGGVMLAVAPRATSVRAWLSGADAEGRPVSTWWLTASVLISWIFAKSVTNAANLGASYGLVGGLAYACYWLAIPLAGLVIHRLRTREGATGLVPFLIARYGRGAAAVFALAILIRLYNEVWSNTAVVGGYFGAPGTVPYYAAALLFTAVTLTYSLKGGMRSSIVTDALQAVVFVFVLGLVLFTVFPVHGAGELLASGSFRLDAGVDLLLVALLQILSYPFHDPVLTDRGFLGEERGMLKAFTIAGALGFVCILLFSLVGVHARLEGIAGDGNVPVAVGRSLGIAAFFFMSVIMISSAGSTLDSTFSSLSRLAALDGPLLRGRIGGQPSIRVGALVMVVIAIVGNLPLIAGTEILRATTISGTMVMGLAPAFLLYRWVGWSPASFHLAFWPGLALGIGHATAVLPAWLRIGEGAYGMLLGANAWGLGLCTALFLAPLAWRRRRPS